MERKTILILDDQPEVLLYLKTSIDSAKYDCLICKKSSDALKIVKNFNLHAIITDLCLDPSDCSGIEFIKQARHLGYSGKIAIISGYLPSKIDDAYYEIIDIILEKPFKIKDLITWLNSF